MYLKDGGRERREEGIWGGMERQRKGNKKERERIRIFHLLPHSPSVFHSLGWDQAKARSLELNLHFPCRWQT